MLTGSLAHVPDLLQTLPPSGRHLATNFLSIASGKYASNTPSQAKNMGTFCTRSKHFVRFLEGLGLDLTLRAYPPPTQTLIAVIYLSLLAEGHTEKLILVRKPTLVGYMEAVSEYTLKWTGRNICLDPDPTKDPMWWKPHPMINLIYEYQTNFKGKQNKKEPLTKRMIEHMLERAKLIQHTAPDCLALALIDWLILSLTTAFRGIEWCQEHNPEKKGFREYHQQVEYTNNRIYAMCKEDWEFQDEDKRPIKNPLLITDLDKVPFVGITYRFQKDKKKHNTKITYKTLPSTAPEWCPTRAMLRILRRHRRLGAPDNKPLAVYKRCTGSQWCSYMTKAEVTRKINNAGRECYSTPGVPFKKKWTLHSCRIGAVAILYGLYQDAELIRSQLRWDSEKWRAYIRHTPINAVLHGRAVETIDSDMLELPSHTITQN